MQRYSVSLIMPNEKEIVQIHNNAGINAADVGTAALIAAENMIGNDAMLQVVGVTWLSKPVSVPPVPDLWRDAWRNADRFRYAVVEIHTLTPDGRAVAAHRLMVCELPIPR